MPLIAGFVLGALCAGSSAASESITVRRSAEGMLVITGGPSKASAGSSRGAGETRLRPRTPPRDLAPLFEREARKQGLDRRLVEAVTQVESAFDVRALSNKGAMGLMQLMPATARDLGVDDPWDAAQNIAGGTRYLRQMLDRFGGRLEHALAAYNAGPGAVERYAGIPPFAETVGYVQKVLGLYRGEVPNLVVARSRVSQRAASIQVHRDANGHLVLTTP